MTIWFTADWHFSHEAVVTLGSGRPFATIEEHDAELIRRHNALVSPQDRVWVLGDVAMGRIERSLALCAQMNGHKVLICGNHDRPAMTADSDKRERWTRRYVVEGGFSQVYVVTSWSKTLPSGRVVTMCHYPYHGDSQESDRYTDRRPVDLGDWLLHGHVHGKWRQRERMINVGVDVWDYAPVPVSAVEELIKDQAALT